MSNHDKRECDFNGKRTAADRETLSGLSQLFTPVVLSGAGMTEGSSAQSKDPDTASFAMQHQGVLTRIQRELAGNSFFLMEG